MRRCRLVVLLIAPAAAVPAAAQDERDIPAVRYPPIPAAGAAAGDFVPKGWAIERQAAGDLDRDGRADLALVLRMRDPRNVLRHDGLGEDPFDTNPRILTVALAAPGGGYRRVLANHRLIPRRDMPTQADPFRTEDTDFRIARGALRLSLYRFMNAGGWGMGPTAFTFRWQQGAMRLIGFDFTNVQRNSGCVSGLSVNYLTGRARTKLTHIGIEREAVRWRRLPRTPLLTLEEVGNGLEFGAGGLVEDLEGDCHGAGLAPAEDQEQ